jgi:predicted kinase
MNRSLTILAGVPQSGKSTYARNLKLSMAGTIICPDDIRLALHGQPYVQEAEPFVWGMAEVMARALLKSGHNIIIDATNTTPKRRKQWVSLAEEFNLLPACVVVDTAISTCFARARELGEPGERLVPVIERMAQQFITPTTEEGMQVARVSGDE